MGYILVKLHFLVGGNKHLYYLFIYSYNQYENFSVLGFFASYIILPVNKKTATLTYIKFSGKPQNYNCMYYGNAYHSQYVLKTNVHTGKLHLAVYFITSFSLFW